MGRFFRIPNCRLTADGMSRTPSPTIGYFAPRNDIVIDMLFFWFVLVFIEAGRRGQCRTPYSYD